MSNGSFGECIESAQRKHLFTTELEALDQLLDDVTARRNHTRESTRGFLKTFFKEFDGARVQDDVAQQRRHFRSWTTFKKLDDIQKAEFFRRVRTLECDGCEQHQGCVR